MTEIGTTESQLITTIEIYNKYHELFTPEPVSNDNTGDIDFYYLENKDGNKRDSFRVILTPSGAVAIGGFFKNVWDISTQRDYGENKKENQRNIKKSDRDCLLLERLNQLLKDKDIYGSDSKELFIKIESARYYIIPFSLEDTDDISLLEDFLKHKIELKSNN